MVIKLDKKSLLLLRHHTMRSALEPVALAIPAQKGSSNPVVNENLICGEAGRQ